MKERITNLSEGCEHDWEIYILTQVLLRPIQELLGPILGK